MPRPKSNALLPLVAGVVLLMGAFVAIKTLTQETDDPALMTAVPQPGEPDADSPAETIRTLTAKVAELTHETHALRTDNDTLHQDNTRLLDQRQALEQQVERRVARAFQDQKTRAQSEQQAAGGLISSLTRRVDDLSSMMQTVQTGSGHSTDIPVGLGLDGLGAGGLIWHEPLDAPDETSSQGGLLQTAAHLPSTPASVQGTQDPPPVKPVYTVPENATLMGSTAFTALIGRIPLRGRVQDPWPFKLITGADNLTANGLEIPEVAGMVWSGTAVGDWTLSCVRGQVTSVTFIFNDGTIRTLTPAGRGQDAGATVNEGVTSDQGLGWISDRFGAPCVSGERITNAPAFLAQRAGLLALQAGADAFAERETTTLLSGQTGTATDFVSGNTGRFILGRTLSGGAEEINKWLLERQQQSFDAVFVRAGAEVAIHVTQQLQIDYDPQGRKLRHAQALDLHHHGRLD